MITNSPTITSGEIKYNTVNIRLILNNYIFITLISMLSLSCFIIYNTKSHKNKIKDDEDYNNDQYYCTACAPPMCVDNK